MVTYSDSRPFLSRIQATPSVVIAGGGLAGLASATRLASLGVRPIVIEKRPFLGGRAFSFVDHETNVEVDNGQHIFLGACHEYIDFVKTIGASNDIHISNGFDVPVLHHNKISRLSTSPFSGTLGMMSVLFNYAHLGWADRMRAAYGLLKIRMTHRQSSNKTLDNMSFAKWLKWQWQSDETIDKFWNLVVLPALNDDISQVSADAGIMFFQTAFMNDPGDSSIGYAKVGLTKLAGDSAHRWIESHGGTIRTKTEIVALESDSTKTLGMRTANGGLVSGDAYVLALPFSELSSELPKELAQSDPFVHIPKLEVAPIVAIHIWYDRQVIQQDFIAILDSPIQWIFNVTEMHDKPGPDHHIVISLSGAWEWHTRAKKDLSTIFVNEMTRLFDRAKNAEVKRVVIVKQLAATFRSSPGASRFRPNQKTPVPNLFLAGDWTQTGWPSTMESAIRSGNRAADAVVKQLEFSAPKQDVPSE